MSARAQSEILRQVSNTTGISGIGMSISNVHGISTKVVHEEARAAREEIKSKNESNMILHFDGKIVKVHIKGKNWQDAELLLV